LQALPAQEACYRSKGQILRQKTGQFLQSPRNNLAFMGRQERIARKDMPFLIAMREYLTRQM
jgi:hypothetical protein